MEASQSDMHEQIERFPVEVPSSARFGGAAAGARDMLRSLVAAVARGSRRGALVRALQDIRRYAEAALRELDEHAIDDARYAGLTPSAGGSFDFVTPIEERRRLLYRVRANAREDAEFKLRAFATFGSYAEDVRLRAVGGVVVLNSAEIEDPIETVCSACGMPARVGDALGVHRCRVRRYVAQTPTGNGAHT